MNLLRILVRAVAALLALASLAAVLIGLNGWRLAHRTSPDRLRALVVAPDSSLLARGEHMARTSCASCHARAGQLPLGGGTDDFLAEPGMPPFGHLAAPNLTPGGRLAAYSDAALARAIREGVSAEGRPLLVMPSAGFHGLSDRDVAALVAYLRSQPADSFVARRRELSPLAYLVLGLRLFPLSDGPEVRGPQDGPPEAATPEYGAYLARYLGCPECHGAALRGGTTGQFPPLGPDLVALAAAHPPAAFELALRHGRSAIDGHPLDPTRMPYLVFANLTDTEVGALYAVLKAGGLASRPD